MESEKLLPCPFCGAEDKYLVQAFTQATETFAFWSVECSFCGVEVADDESQEKANAAWNTRAPADCKLADGDGRDCVLLEDHEGGCLSYDPKEVGVRLMSALGHVENCRAHGRVTDAGFAAIRSALLIADRELSRLRAPADLRSVLEAETIEKLRDAAALVARAIGVTQMPDGTASALVFSGNDPGPQLEDILSARAAIASLEGHVS